EVPEPLEGLALELVEECLGIGRRGRYRRGRLAPRLRRPGRRAAEGEEDDEERRQREERRPPPEAARPRAVGPYGSGVSNAPHDRSSNHPFRSLPGARTGTAAAA